ncbi:MAG: stage V sporulation protein AE [Oscillospiraceae bacterium]|nr:stage V sporulation protein AE [Oscillospiraceae bacterium]
MDFLWAFVIGGSFCLIGQLLIDLTKISPARILVAFVVAGVLLGGIGAYKPLVEFAGAGATVPLTGFGYLLAEGVQKAIGEKGLLGVFTGGFTAAAAGITAVVVFALIVSALFKRGDRMS